MLTSLRIQNFRSIRDASVKLGQLNLFIGPNNSGKSNFLKGIELAAGLLANTNKNGRAGRDNLPKDLQNQPYDSPATMAFSTVSSDEKGKQTIVVTALIDDSIRQQVFTESDSFQSPASIGPEFFNVPFQATPHEVSLLVRNAVIYNTNPERLRTSASLKHQYSPTPDGTDAVLFLFTLGQNDRAALSRLEADLQLCVRDMVAVSTPPVPDKPGDLKIRLFDQREIGYWAEEVSEGVIYFLALLCIIHQPAPPKLLMIEEPEKGIHPRRIREVLDFLLDLAQSRGIQIIITSHHPYVVDYFADIPDCISVFDRDPATGETVVHNADDIMSETNGRLAAKGGQPIRYTSSLGEHWVTGFLGGVPA